MLHDQKKLNYFFHEYHLNDIYTYMYIYLFIEAKCEDQNLCLIMNFERHFSMI